MNMAGAKVVVGVSLFVIVCVLIAVSTATDFWITSRPSDSEGWTASMGLWRVCEYNGQGMEICERFPIIRDDMPAFIYGTRAFMVSACILAFIAMICTVPIFIAERAKLYNVVVGIMYAITGLFGLVGTTWFARGYTAGVQPLEDPDAENFSYGYSIIVGWVSLPFAIASALLIVSQAYFSSHEHFDSLLQNSSKHGQSPKYGIAI